MATVFEGTTYIPVFGNDIVMTVTSGGASLTALVTSVSYTDAPPLTEIRNGAGETSMRVWSDNEKSKRLSLEVVPYGTATTPTPGTQTALFPDAGVGITIASAAATTEAAGAWIVISKTIRGTNDNVQTIALELAKAL